MKKLGFGLMRLPQSVHTPSPDVLSVSHPEPPPCHGKTARYVLPKCEKRCPQHLPIREYLEAVAGELE